MIKAYCKLWVKYQRKPFTFKQAQVTLNDKNDTKLSMTLSRLAKTKWLAIIPTKQDKRIKQYTLLETPNGVVEAIAKS